MIQKIKTIVELTDEQIDAINVYLSKMGRETFTIPQVNFIKNREELDVLDLLDNVACVRGFFVDRDLLVNTHRVNVNADQQTLDEIVQEFTESLDPNDYDEADYKELIEDHRKSERKTIQQYAIFLNTSAYLSTDILYLNEDFEPLEVDAVNLSEGW